MKNVFSKIWKFFFEKHTPTRHIKYKAIDFAPCNKSIMQISFFQPVWNDF